MNHLPSWAVALGAVADLAIGWAIWRFVFVPKIRAIVVATVSDELSARMKMAPTSAYVRDLRDFDRRAA